MRVDVFLEDDNIFAVIDGARQIHVANASSEKAGLIWPPRYDPRDMPSIEKAGDQVRTLVDNLARGSYPSPASDFVNVFPRGDRRRVEFHITAETITMIRNEDESTRIVVANTVGSVAGSGAQVQAMLEAAYPGGSLMRKAAAKRFEAEVIAPEEVA